MWLMLEKITFLTISGNLPKFICATQSFSGLQGMSPKHRFQTTCGELRPLSNLSEMKTSALSLQDFAVAIRASWNKAIESVIETAQMIKRAEDQLDRRQLGELKRRLEQERIMSGPTFSKLAKIAANPVLTAPENLPRLPNSYATLYELAQYDDAIVQQALEEGTIHAAIKHKDVGDVLPSREKRTKQVTITGTNAKISVSIRFSAENGEVPDELLKRLNELLLEISTYTDIKQTGLDA